MRKLTSKNPSAATDRDIPEELRRSSIHKKYRLSSLVGRDFAGALYASGKRAGKVTLAVKVLDSDFFLVPEIIGKIDHSRIGKIRDTIVDKTGIQAVVLDMPAGRRLSELTNEGHEMTEGEAVSATLQLLSALHAVHWNDEILGNLHADSIYISRDIHDNLELSLINVGVGCFDDAMEKPYYQAPEQISAKGSDRRSDIWAVGVLFYEMLFGKRPFAGENRYEIGGEVLLKEPSYQSTWSNIPDDLLAIVKHALMKDPRRRYDNVSNMVADLIPFQAEFKEPMSDDASRAVRNSCPPPGIGQNPVSPKVSRAKPIQKLTAGLKSINPVSKPAPAKKTGVKSGVTLREKAPTPIPAVKSKIIKKSVISVPPIAAAETAAPSPGDDTSSPIVEEVKDTSASLTTADTTSVDAPYPLEPEEDRIAPAEPTGLEKAMISAKNAVKAVTRKLGILAEDRRKWVAVAAAALVALLIVIVALPSGNAPNEDGERRSATLEAKAAPQPGPATTQPPPPPPPTPPVAPPETEAPPESITVTLSGLPSGAIVQLGDKTVTSPFSVPYSTTPREITIRKRGYLPQTQTLVPQDDITINISLKKKDIGDKKAKRIRVKKDINKNRPSSNELADNPFGG